MAVTFKAAALAGWVLAAAAVVVVVVVASAGAMLREAVPSPLTPGAGCAAAGAAGPWKAVFGHRRTAAGAATLFRHAERVGFKNLAIVRAGPADFEADLFGIPTYRTGLELRGEARSAGLQVTIEPSHDRYCPDQDADWEGVFSGRRRRIRSTRTTMIRATFTKRGSGLLQTSQKGRDSGEAHL